MSSGGNNLDAAAWGRCLAALVHGQCGKELRQIISAWQWQLQIAEADEPNFPLPRFAVWEGDTKTIRLFRAPLQRRFANGHNALALACAHEMFHGLVANAYLNLLPRMSTRPSLTKADEEIAAHAFACALIENFCLTLEA